MKSTVMIKCHRFSSNFDETHFNRKKLTFYFANAHLYWQESEIYFSNVCYFLQQESEISNMENRNYFSLHCVQMETQLIHANLDALHVTMENLAAEESKAHAEVWLICSLLFECGNICLRRI